MSCYKWHVRNVFKFLYDVKQKYHLDISKSKVKKKKNRFKIVLNSLFK